MIRSLRLAKCERTGRDCSSYNEETNTSCPLSIPTWFYGSRDGTNRIKQWKVLTQKNRIVFLCISFTSQWIINDLTVSVDKVRHSIEWQLNTALYCKSVVSLLVSFHHNLNVNHKNSTRMAIFTFGNIVNSFFLYQRKNFEPRFTRKIRVAVSYSHP